LALRYRIRPHGLKEILDRGHTGILFLPNHPALIDPVILTALLLIKFAPRPLGDRDQIDRFFIRWFARRIGVRPIPDAARIGLGSAEQIRTMLAETIEGLKRGENALMYPAGRLTRTRLEDLGGNSAAELLLGSVPNVRVVLVRTRGLWGSRFSYANSRELNLRRILWKCFRSLLANGLFFGPRRRVDIEFEEPADLPRTADRLTLNRYLERFYNQGALPNTYVPYALWERGGVREQPEPRAARDWTEGSRPQSRFIAIGDLLVGAD
jgi:long-chain-fatty-acid--[acyl-carrier-protein] ligase